jgi:serine/threonine protein kinase
LERVPAEKDTIAAEVRREGSREPPVRDDLRPTLAFRPPGDTADTDAPTWFRNRQKPNVADDSLVGTDFGQYRILEKIGAGGMGCVYRAVHTRLQKVVALKTFARASQSRTTCVFSG